MNQSNENQSDVNQHTETGPVDFAFLRKLLGISLITILSAGYSVDMLAQAEGEADEQETAEQNTEEQQPAATSEKAQEAEKLQVTGSRIKRADIEKAKPLIVIDRDQIQNSGKTTIAEVLNDAIATPTGNFTGEGNFLRSGASTIDILGIGSGRTLVLLDGMRLPNDVSIGGANVNNIPLAIVDKIEIYTGGASAVYGSEAIGGVVNIFTKKDMNGTEAVFSGRAPQEGGGEQQSYSVANGTTIGSNFNVLTTAGYNRRNEVWWKNRDIKASRPANANSLAYAPYGTFAYRLITPTEDGATATPWQPSPNCPEASQIATNPNTPDNVYCAGDRKENNDSWLYGKTESMFFTNRMEYFINDFTSVRSFLFYDRNRSEFNRGNFLTIIDNPFNSRVNSRGILLTPERARDFNIEVEDNQVVEVLAKAHDFPMRKNINIDETYGGSLNLNIDQVANRFDTQFNFAHYISTNRRDFQNVLNRQKLMQTFFGEDPPQKSDPDYLPFDSGRDNGVLIDMVDDLESKEKAVRTFVEAFASTEIFDLPGGPFEMGLGTSFSHDEYQQFPDSRDVEFYGYPVSNPQSYQPTYTGTAGASGKGFRDSVAVYTEFVAPVFDDVVVEGALRHEQFSDFGSPTNWSLGAKYEMIESLTFRGNVATSFKAPDLNLLHQKNGGGYESIVDYAYCERIERPIDQCGAANQMYVDRPANKDLKEETGKSYNIGMIFEPTINATQKFSLLVDYYGITLHDSLSRQLAQNVADDYYNGKTDLGKAAVTTDEDGIITTMAVPWENIGEITIHAVKGEVDYDITLLPWLKTLYSFSMFRYLSYKVTDVVSTRESGSSRQQKQVAGLKGIPRWIMTNSLGFDMFSYHRVNFVANTIAKQQQDPDTVVQARGVEYHSTPQYTKYDMNYRYETPWNADLVLGVLNLQNKLGGLDDSGSAIGAEGTNRSLYDYYGRTYYMTYVQRF